MGRSPQGEVRAAVCDTNVLVRLLTSDPPDQARAVARTLASRSKDDPPIILTEIVVAELVYVLAGVYRVARRDVADRVAAIMDLASIDTASEPMLRDALDLWSTSARLDFADAYLAAIARAIEGAAVLSLDGDFDKLHGVYRLSPGDTSKPRAR